MRTSTPPRSKTMILTGPACMGPMVAAPVLSLALGAGAAGEVGLHDFAENDGRERAGGELEGALDVGAVLVGAPLDVGVGEGNTERAALARDGVARALAVSGDHVEGDAGGLEGFTLGPADGAGGL